MEIPRVGIDIDDTKADFLPQFCDYLNINHGFAVTPHGFYSCHLSDVVRGLTRAEEYRLIDAFTQTPEYEHLMPVEGSQEGVANLAQRYRLNSLTARPLWKEGKTRRWVAANFPHTISQVNFADGITHGLSAKTMKAKELGIRVVIEDHPGYAAHMSANGIGVVLLTRWPYAQDVPEMPNVVKVPHWSAVPDAVDTFFEAMIL